MTDPVTTTNTGQVVLKVVERVVWAAVVIAQLMYGQGVKQDKANFEGQRDACRGEVYTYKDPAYWQGVYEQIEFEKKEEQP